MYSHESVEFCNFMKKMRDIFFWMGQYIICIIPFETFNYEMPS